jgi:chitin disaccharide deacetylase
MRLPSSKRREIRTQFEVFRATGLELDHVNAHKHMHLHPTVAGLILKIGRDYRMPAIRVPAEPVGVLRRAFPHEHLAPAWYRPWAELLRHRLRHAGLVTNDHVFGLGWSGDMVEQRLLRLLPYLPNGVSEAYFHPATERSPALIAAMRDYRHREELEALTSPVVKARIEALGIALSSCAELVG